jgi:pimeloyl-ACP methyl ester carboxylesterase
MQFILKNLLHTSESKYLVIFVQGFLGSKNSPLCQSIFNDLSMYGIDFFTFDFPGHGEDIAQLASLSEMTVILSEQIQKLESMNPTKKIILIGHSQGSVVIYNYLINTKRAIPTLFLTPAFDIFNIISARLSIEDMSKLKTSNIKKEFRPNTTKVITANWMEEYKNQKYDFQLPNSKYLAIFGNEDNIVDPIKNLGIYNKISDNSKHIFIKGNHTFLNNTDELNNIAYKFIAEA